MTKKHFEALALTLKEAREAAIAGPFVVSPLEIADDFIARITTFCATQNPSFDAERFLTAVCGNRATADRNFNLDHWRNL